MNSYGLAQLVQEPTRVIEDKSATLIDHIYANVSENVQYVDVPKIGLSDHYPVFLTRKINGCIPVHNHHTITYRCFKTFYEELFKNDLSSTPWNIVQIFDDVDDALDTWYSLFYEVVDKHISLRTHG